MENPGQLVHAIKPGSFRLAAGIEVVALFYFLKTRPTAHKAVSKEGISS